MPSPHQTGIHRAAIYQIRQAHLLTHRKSLGNNRHTSFRADIDGIALGFAGLAAFRPLHAHRHPRVQPYSGAQMLRSRPKSRFVRNCHKNPLRLAQSHNDMPHISRFCGRPIVPLASHGKFRNFQRQWNLRAVKYYPSPLDNFCPHCDPPFPRLTLFPLPT